MNPQIITDSEASHWTSGNLDFISVHFSRIWPWLPNGIQNIHWAAKMTVDHWATIQCLFPLAQVWFFWCCLLLGSGFLQGMWQLLAKSHFCHAYRFLQVVKHDHQSSKKSLKYIPLCVTNLRSFHSNLICALQPPFMLHVGASLCLH